MNISGNIIDLFQRKIYPGTISFQNGIITAINQTSDEININIAKDKFTNFILPGFVDAHVHIESSMLIPSEFARLSVVHGTVATVSDPHEIANVMGIEGIRYMINNGKQVPFKFYFGASSCVPATAFETAGAEISPAQINELFEIDKLKYLSEMMNYPGVLNNDPLVMEKINIAKYHGLPIDGHAPGLKGELAKKYISAGISTDHECFSLNEAIDKINFGMKILIRDGSAAKNFEALHPLIQSYPQYVMFCSDDKHPNDLVVSHIDEIVRKSLKLNYDLFDVLFAACVNPVLHYNLDVGLMRQGDPADFIVVNNLNDFKVMKTFIDGYLAALNGSSLLPKVNSEIINNFNTNLKSPSDFEISAKDDSAPVIRVIKAIDGELITEEIHEPAKLFNAKLIANTENDVLKIAVISRYNNSNPAVAFIRNFGLSKGAIASSVAHDSHNIIAVGVSDLDICNAVNAIILNKGGISLSYDGKTDVLPLPVAGIMSIDDGFKVARLYNNLDISAKKIGANLNAPFMTLSFMALLVIPQLKLSDKGLFDGKKFEFVDLFVK